MCQTRIFRTRVIAAAAAAILCPEAWAEESALPSVVVTGKRAIMMSYQEF